ncbi:chondroitin AC/alginate lyase [Trametes elegans]|nr:chondroitin AC/alginate lyase [Trametes elegans]
MESSRFRGRWLCVLVFASTAGLVVADSNDWVNVKYVVQQSNAGNTAGARQNIINKAGSSAKGGPWSIVTNNGVVPPSGDVHDYLSWAPYHWPDCNWCSKGTSHLSNPGGQSNNTGDTGDDGDSPSYDGDNPYEDGGDHDDGADAYELSALNNITLLRRASDHGPSHSSMHHRMLRRKRTWPSPGPLHGSPARRQDDGESQTASDPLSSFPLPSTDDIPSAPTYPPNVGGLAPDGTSTWSSTRTMTGTPAPAAAAAKTKNSKCTPSPTKSLAPSATWTTCPYVVRDGNINPDVRTIPDADAVVSMSQSVLYNAVAFGLQKTRTYSQNVARFIDTFFLTPATAMNPNMNYGQQVRGPGKDHQMGSYTGIIDLRSIVKVVNAIQIMKAAASPDWTSAREKTMSDWMQTYASWLQNSALGKEAASKANNHLTFYVNQLAVTKMYGGDTQGALNSLKQYFTNQFLDQIAASGEQPFEAIRTRPYHYRCFNLEAMITNAKLGDQLGMNFWSAKSKYGATIQTALDFTMNLNPKDEDVSDIFPHVAAVAAAYGDPKGKYAAFLKKQDSNYANEPFWFYDQSSALPSSPAGGHANVKHRRGVDESVARTPNATHALVATALDAAQGVAAHVLDAASGTIPFDCPAVFQAAKDTELEDGLFVTCDQLRPFYEVLSDVDLGAM